MSDTTTGQSVRDEWRAAWGLDNPHLYGAEMADLAARIDLAIAEACREAYILGATNSRNTSPGLRAIIEDEAARRWPDQPGAEGAR